MKKINKFFTLTVLYQLLSSSVFAQSINLVNLSLNENNGTVATDSSGEGNDAALTNITWNNGKEGSALTFDGSSSYAELNNDTNSALYNLHKGDYSIAAWIKPETALGHRSGVINRWGVHEGLFYNTNKTFSFIHKTPSGTKTVTSSQAFEPGEYVHIAASVDGTTGKLSLFVNGQIDTTTSYTANEHSTQSLWRPWRIGVKDIDANTASARENFNGTIDQVKLYSGVLSSDEVNSIWAEHTLPNTLVYLPLNENTGTTTADLSGNNNNATLNSATWVTGRNGAAIEFNGPMSYVDLSNVNNDDLDNIHNDNFSISAWVKANEALGHRSGVINRWGVHEGLFYNADKTLSFHHKTPSGTKTATTSTAYEPGSFNYVVASVNGDSGQLDLYVNGVLEDSTIYAQGDHSTQSLWRPWRLGIKDIDASSSGARENFSGTIDDVKFFQDAVTKNEADLLWQQQIAQCNMGENAGTGTGNFPALLEYTGEKYGDFVSFEQAEVPNQWITDKGILSIHADRSKQGNKSLQWEWVSGDTLTVTDLVSQGFDSTVIDTTDYTQSDFRLWLYNENAISGDPLKIEFYDDQGALQYHYTVHLNFTGWRSASIQYREGMLGNKANKNLTSMKIKAPTSYCSGKLLLDLVDFTAPKDVVIGSDYQVPQAGGNNHWTNMLHYETYTKGTELTPTAQEISDADTIKERYRTEVLQVERNRVSGIIDINEAIAIYDKINIVVNGGTIQADEPLFGKYHKHKGDFGVTLNDIDSIILMFARDYIDNYDTLSRDRVLNLVRYMLDQGFAAGSFMENGSHIGYAIRSITSAILLMELELKTAGLWEEALDSLFWNNAVEAVWQPLSENVSDSDHARTRIPGMLGVITHIGDDVKRIQYLKGYRSHINTFLTTYNRGGEGMKPDYSGFHHNTQFPGYTYGALSSTATAMRLISGTSFAPTAESFELAKKMVLSYAVHHAGIDMPLSLSGRNPFSIPTVGKTLLELGQASPTTAEKNMFYAEYNRLYKADEDLTLAITPAENPNGFWQFNYRPMGVYRQDNWVANIKGFSKYFWGTEIYTTANRYGRYQSYGSISINYQLPQAERGETKLEAPIKGLSGFVEDGWDWNMMPGTTTIHLPWSDLLAEKNRQDEWGNNTFAGALRFGAKTNYYIEGSLEGQCGLYGFDLAQRGSISTTHNDDFTAKKSVFACNGMMIALGSDINNYDSQNITATNLFQQSSLEAPYSLIENGVTQSATDYSSTLISGDNWLIDRFGTGYYVKSGNHNIEVRTKAQTSPYHKENGVTFNTGEFSSAWIDHGLTPNNASYEYVIVPKTTSSAMTSFASEMQTTPSYQVLQQDNNAHVLSFTGQNKEGYVLFSPTTGISGAFVEATDTPLLIMAQQVNNQLALSLVNPDHNFSGSAPIWGANQLMTATLTLKGKWQLTNTVSAVTNVSVVGNTTVITIDTNNAEAYDLNLISVIQ